MNPPALPITDLLTELEAAWNDADGTRWGLAFDDTAVFVDIRGDYHRGRHAIAAGHQAIFDTVYKGSTVRYELVDHAPLVEGCDVAVIRSALDAPAGPLAGIHHSTSTVVVTNDGERARIAAFHNTLVPQDR